MESTPLMAAFNVTIHFTPGEKEVTNITRCSIFNGEEYKCNVLVYARRSMSAISLIGCVFVLCLIWLFRKYIIFAQRLFLYLSVSVIFYCIFSIAADAYEEGGLCTFLAWGLNVFLWSVLLWVCCITFNLHMNAVWMKNTEKFEWVYHVVAWVFPVLISMLPFIGNRYGPAGTWCWIKRDLGWRFGIWYGPNAAILVLMITVYCHTFYTIYKKVRAWEGLYDPHIIRQKKILREDIQPLKVYPFVYLGCSVFAFTNRIQNAVDTQPIFGLMLMHALTAPLSGAINAVIFALDKDTRSKLNWTEIKLAIRGRRFRNKRLIQEYPTGNPPIRTVSSSQLDAMVPSNDSRV